MWNSYSIQNDITILNIHRKNLMDEDCYIDTEDLEKVSQANTWVMTGSGVVVSNKSHPLDLSKQVTIQDYIMDYFGPNKVIHIDGDALNNKKENLMIATDEKMNRMRGKRQRSERTSCWVQKSGSKTKPWVVRYGIPHKTKRIYTYGTFLTREEAEIKAREVWKTFKDFEHPIANKTKTRSLSKNRYIMKNKHCPLRPWFVQMRGGGITTISKNVRTIKEAKALIPETMERHIANGGKCRPKGGYKNENNNK